MGHLAQTLADSGLEALFVLYPLMWKTPVYQEMQVNAQPISLFHVSERILQMFEIQLGGSVGLCFLVEIDSMS